MGLSFEKDTCLAYRYSLPNKIFDYISAEVPVLVSDLPEFKSIVKKYNIGFILESREPQDIAVQMQKILKTSKTQWLSDMEIAKKRLCWENEEKKLISLFH